MSKTTPSPTLVHLWGSKGGVGTSTVAALIAAHAYRRRAVELKATTAEGVQELAAILGRRSPSGRSPQALDRP